jgi:FAD:protein FMN transferase
VIGLLLALAGAGAEEPAWSSRSEVVLSTTVVVMVPTTHRDAGDDVFAVFRHVEATANEWKPESPLSALNVAAGQGAVSIPQDLMALLGRSVEIAERTEGAFDPTWAALWGLWDFKAEPPVVPSQADIALRVARVDHAKLRLDPAAGTAELTEAGMLVGVGGIAKGWALDRAAELLDARGVEHYALSAGGQVLARGRRGDRPWRVGIRDPRSGVDDAFAMVSISDASVSTSGDYERYFEVDGVRHHHILDPRTGWPAKGTRSATVIAPEATLADALSTALLVLGPEHGMDVVKAWDGVEAVWVDDQGVVHASPGASITTLHPPLRR